MFPSLRRSLRFSLLGLYGRSFYMVSLQPLDVPCQTHHQVVVDVDTLVSKCGSILVVDCCAVVPHLHTCGRDGQLADTISASMLLEVKVLRLTLCLLVCLALRLAPSLHEGEDHNLCCWVTECA